MHHPLYPLLYRDITSPGPSSPSAVQKGAHAPPSISPAVHRYHLTSHQAPPPHLLYRKKILPHPQLYINYTRFHYPISCLERKPSPLHPPVAGKGHPVPSFPRYTERTPRSSFPRCAEISICPPSSFISCTERNPETPTKTPSCTEKQHRPSPPFPSAVQKGHPFPSPAAKSGNIFKFLF
jgi:hypothetical protein